MSKSKYLYRAFRSVGLKVERSRDALKELQALAGGSVSRVVDGGAYKGTVSQAFLSMFPAAEVHAFEPQPDLFAKLKTISAPEERWHIHNAALAATTGEHAFHVPTAAFTGSLLAPGETFGSAREIMVGTVTLDSWADTHGAADVLKLDLQGAELQALEGAQNMLSHVRVILCEVNFVPRYEDCSLFHNVASYLAEHGFLLHRLYDIRSLSSGAWEMADAIFVRR